MALADSVEFWHTVAYVFWLGFGVPASMLYGFLWWRSRRGLVVPWSVERRILGAMAVGAIGGPLCFAIAAVDALLT